MSFKQSFLIVLASLGMAVGFSACFDDASRPALSNPVLRSGTAGERVQSVKALQAAWRERPKESAEGNRRAELRFLKTLGTYLYSIRDSDEFADACVVWNECVHEHTLQYGDLDR